MSKDILKLLDDELGTNAENQGVNNYLDTKYPPLNAIIGGKGDRGLPYGRLIEVVGESSSGKTLLATQWLIEAQVNKGVAVFVDWERSFSVELAKSMGLITDRPYWFFSRPKTWEDGNIYGIKVCRVIRENNVIPPEAPIVVVFDSVASAIPQSMIEKNMDAYTMNDTTALARVSSTTLKVMAQQAEEYNATFVYLNQVRTKPGAYIPTETTPGGKAMEFYSTVRLFLSKKKIFDKDKKFIGQRITIEARKNKLTKPFGMCAIDMYYDDDNVPHFDLITPLVDALIDKKIIPTSGSYIEWKDKKMFKSAFIKKVIDEAMFPELCKLYQKA